MTTSPPSKHDAGPVSLVDQERVREVVAESVRNILRECHGQWLAGAKAAARE